MKKRTPQIQAKYAGRRFSIEIPPVEWILKYQNWWVGKLKDGSFLVVDEWNESDGTAGWTVHPHKDFKSILKEGSYDHDFLRTLAHKLGIERLRVNFDGFKNMWLDTDDYLADAPDTNTPEALKAYHQQRVVNLQLAGRWKTAVAYERAVEKWLQ